MPSVFSKLRGTIETIFQIGLSGPNLKANSGALEARNAGDSAFAVMRGASPVGNNDLVTKLYADQLAARYIVTAQFNGGSALPSNTSTEHFIVVTTSGVNANIGQLLFDDGSGSGTVTVITAASGFLILTTTSFTGGTVSFAADSLYMWDSVASSWINAGGSVLSGSIREIRFALNNSASQSSATSIPANAIVVDALLNVTTPYSAGATISIGRTGSTALLQATTDNLATVSGIYLVPQDTSWGASPLPVLATIAGAPSAGVAQLTVRYTQPDA